MDEALANKNEKKRKKIIRLAKFNTHARQQTVFISLIREELVKVRGIWLPDMQSGAH